MKHFILTIFLAFFLLFVPSFKPVLAAPPVCNSCAYPLGRCWDPNIEWPPPFEDYLSCIVYEKDGCSVGINLYCCHDSRNPPSCASEIGNPLIGSSLSSGTATSVVQKIIVNLVNLAYVAGVVIFFFMLIAGGLQWIASGGDKAAVANARSKISHAVIGLIVLMGVFAIVYFMESLFDVDLLRIDIGLISL